ADNTAGSPGGNVGRCQLIEFLLYPKSLSCLTILYNVGQGKLFYFTSCFLIFLSLHSTLNIQVLHLQQQSFYYTFIIISLNII
ncbi:hypothetical protein N5S92_06385, partial [Aliarcobacter cryaerophilus]|uniref:hypothetical protein n=1 Tax=Aliarcobacter cryaerophilus TaxID=28198 RepID=UPI0021B4093F